MKFTHKEFVSGVGGYGEVSNQTIRIVKQNEWAGSKSPEEIWVLLHIEKGAFDSHNRFAKVCLEAVISQKFKKTSPKLNTKYDSKTIRLLMWHASSPIHPKFWRLTSRVPAGTPEEVVQWVHNNVDEYSYPAMFSRYNIKETIELVGKHLEIFKKEAVGDKFLYSNAFKYFVESTRSSHLFKDFLTEAKNTHMTHAENAVLYQGEKGTKQAIIALQDVFKMLGGANPEGRIITQKVDGAPAVFMGMAPDDGQFFIAKKGIFNKDPKVYKSIDDIKADTSGDLQAKLIATFNAFKNVKFDNIYQGDLMFTKGDLKTATFDGVKHYTFQPNTLVYAIPVDSDLGRRIAKASVGIVFHTKYVGRSYESLSADFNINVDYLKKLKGVWVADAYIENVSGNVNLTPSDAKIVDAKLKHAAALFNKINKSILKKLQDDPELAQNIETFQNSFIRTGVAISDAPLLVKQLIQWYEARFEKEEEKRKSEVGKSKVRLARDERLKFFSTSNRKDLQAMFELQIAIADAKELLFRQLDKINSMSTFVRTKDGFKVAGSEGYVIADVEGNSYKIVDRLEFSYHNFSPDILKGWMKDSRK